MKNQFVPLELEQKLVNFGFDRNNRVYLYTNAGIKITGILWQQVFDWFWNKFDMWGQVFPWNPEINQWQITIYYKVNNEYNDSEYFLKDSDYEEAREACLEKLIELCKKN